MPDQVNEDAAYVSLARNLYWANTPGDRGDLGASHVREQMLEFVAKLRADERLSIPLGEPYLGARTTQKRKAKRRVFRALRFMTRRYDRLLGDAVQLTSALAQRVVQLEHEIEHLRAEMTDEASEGRPDEDEVDRP
jgi:hypothetical protein